MCVNTRKNAGSRVGEALFGGNQSPPQALAARVCGKCGYLHGGECMVGSNACYGCDKSVHMVRKCPHVHHQAKADTQPRPYPTA